MISLASKYSLFIFYTFLFCRELFPQGFLDKQFDLANNLYYQKELFDAVTEYKRLLFFDKGKKYLYSANFMIGMCYKGGAKLDEAIKYFSIASSNSSGDEAYYDSKIQLIRCNILRRTTDQAILMIDELAKDKRFKGKTDDLNYWRGWAYIFSDDWNKASSEFCKINTDHPLKKLCEEVSSELYSVAFSKLISFIIPGAGQIYTGYYVSGFMSLAWNAALIYLSVNSFIEDRVFDGLITTGLFFRFHRGNIQNAERFTLAKNVEISNKMLKFLQEKYSGRKP
jgi:tetratricopeptide (TPR) repeat protein